MAETPVVFERESPCVDAIIARVGRNICLGLPLGLGKAVRLVNALYRRACEDDSLRLHIATAISLEKPRGGQSLEKRFMGPFAERVFEGVPDLDYVAELRRNALPANVRISEFFFQAGSYLHNPGQQQNYICTNYTHAVRDLLALGVNVVAQMVAPHPDDASRYSLSCNPDLSLDLMPLLREREAAGSPVALVAEVNPELPFMPRHAEVADSEFDFLLRGPRFRYPLFPVPPMAIAPADHLIGFYASTLLKDAGTLQVGIGSLGSALVYSTILRHQRNKLYQDILRRLEVPERFPAMREIGGSGPFETGLYGCSEMMVDGFLHLHDAGVLKREVYDDEALQDLLNRKVIGTTPDLDMLDRLLERGLIKPRLWARDCAWLRRFGILRPEVEHKGGQLVVNGEAITPDLGNPESRRLIAEHALGERLTGGSVMHGGFFLGPAEFYQALRDLPDPVRQKFCMSSVNYINDLYDHRFGRQALKVAQRAHSRFVNSAMMQTLSGAAVSDGLEDGRVVSGVGGQYNFVAMAHNLAGARSVLILRSTREAGGKVHSNIVFSYGHTTIPRHLRDIVVTEYGIADLRGKSDQAVYQALINIADSRFQGDLLRQAQKAGKVAGSWSVPEAFRHNMPGKIAEVVDHYRQREIFPAFPFGCAFTPDELRLGKALRTLKSATASRAGRVRALVGAMTRGEARDEWRPLIERMGLERPQGWHEKLDRRLLLQALAMTEKG